MLYELITDMSSMGIIVIGINAVFLILAILYYFIVYNCPKRSFHKRSKEESSPTNVEKPVSIIIYANEQPDDLCESLPKLLSQNYPNYEVIVVNDGSDPKSDDILKLLSSSHKNLYKTYIPKGSKYVNRKKLALTLGIKAAHNDFLLFTEANCCPLNENWISSITSLYKENTQIIIGYCAYRHTRNLFHKLVAYDNLLNGLQYLSSAMLKKPYSADGRNLSYSKSLFNNHKGFYRTIHLEAGDDSLFVNETATKENTEVAFSTDSITEMAPVTYPREWKETKLLRLETEKLFKPFSKTGIQMGNLAILFCILSSIVSIVYGLLFNYLIAAVAILFLIIRYTVKAVILHKESILLQQKPCTTWLPLLEIMRTCYDLYIYSFHIFLRRKAYIYHID